MGEIAGRAEDDQRRRVYRQPLEALDERVLELQVINRLRHRYTSVAVMPTSIPVISLSIISTV